MALLVGAAVAAIATWALTRPAPAKLQPVRFALVPPAAQALAVHGFDRDLVLSADGTHLVYVAGSDAQLMVRAIDQLDAVPLRGITGARSPFLSPDGRWVGFFTGAGGEIRKVSIAGGTGPPAVPHHGRSARRELGAGRHDCLRDERRRAPGCSACPPRAASRKS